jgi:hypothetical protein
LRSVLARYYLYYISLPGEHSPFVVCNREREADLRAAGWAEVEAGGRQQARSTTKQNPKRRCFFFPSTASNVHVHVQRPAIRSMLRFLFSFSLKIVDYSLPRQSQSHSHSPPPPPLSLLPSRLSSFYFLLALYNFGAPKSKTLAPNSLPFSAKMVLVISIPA